MSVVELFEQLESPERFAKYQSKRLLFDRATRDALAKHMALLCARGYGVMFVTHDDNFAAQLPHHVLTVADRALRLA